MHAMHRSSGAHHTAQYVFIVHQAIAPAWNRLMNF